MSKINPDHSSENTYPLKESNSQVGVINATIQNISSRAINRQILQKPVKKMGFFARIWTYLSRPTTAKTYICARKIFEKDSAKEITNLLVQRHGKKQAQELMERLSLLSGLPLLRAVTYLKKPIPDSIKKEDAFLRDLAIVSCCKIFETFDLVNGVQLLTKIQSFEENEGISWIQSGRELAEAVDQGKKISTETLENAKEQLEGEGKETKELVSYVLNQPIFDKQERALAKKYHMTPGKMRRALNTLNPEQKEKAIQFLKKISPETKSEKIQTYILRFITSALSESSSPTKSKIATSTLEALAKNDETSQKIASQLDNLWALMDQYESETLQFFAPYFLNTQFEDPSCVVDNQQLYELWNTHKANIQPKIKTKATVHKKDLASVPKHSIPVPDSDYYTCHVNHELFERLFGKKVGEHFEFDPQQLYQTAADEPAAEDHDPLSKDTEERSEDFYPPNKLEFYLDSFLYNQKH